MANQTHTASPLDPYRREQRPPYNVLVPEVHEKRETQPLVGPHADVKYIRRCRKKLSRKEGRVLHVYYGYKTPEISRRDTSILL